MVLSLSLVACLLAACTPVGTQDDPGEPEEPTGPTEIDPLTATGRVVGFVYTDGSGRASLSARPRIEPGLTPAPGAAVALDTRCHARTNASGLFVISHAPVGDRAGRVWLEGDATQPISVVFEAQVTRGATAALSGAVATGTAATAAGWVYNAPEGGGHVVSAAPRFGLKPAAQVEVAIAGQAARTDRLGFYLLNDVQSGTHDLLVEGDPAGDVTLIGGRTTAGLDGAGGQLAAATGHVGLGFDAPAPYVTIEPTVQTVAPFSAGVVSMDTGQQALTDERGEYTLYGVDPGLRTVTVVVPGRGGVARTLITLPGTVTRGSEAPEGSIELIDLRGAEGLGFVEVGETLPLILGAVAPDGTEWTGFSTFDWSVSDTSKAMVDRRGRVTGKAMGPVRLTARAGGGLGTIDLLVEPRGFRDATTVEAALSGAPVLSVGSTRTITARVLDAEGRELIGYPVDFDTADESVAAVTRKGVVAGLREGSTSVSAVALRTGGVSDSIAIEVIPSGDRLRVDPPELAFDGNGEGQVRIWDVTGGSEGLMTWVTRSSEPWLVTHPTEGVGDGQVGVTALSAGLDPGVYTALLEIDAGDHGLRNVFVEMTVQRLDVIIE